MISAFGISAMLLTIPSNRCRKTCMHTYIHTYIHTYMHACMYVYKILLLKIPPHLKRVTTLPCEIMAPLWPVKNGSVLANLYNSIIYLRWYMCCRRVKMSTVLKFQEVWSNADRQCSLHKSKSITVYCSSCQTITCLLCHNSVLWPFLTALLLHLAQQARDMGQCSLPITVYPS